MRKLFLILFASVFLAGCGSSLKNSWNNFTTYYNTFYNAKEYYRSGLKKVKEQPVNIDPEHPVRIHPSPNQAGYNDFQDAIDKGARVLRKFPESKWVDDAILLIGKSYYYRQEFYPALQKFEELRNAATSPKVLSQAIIWKGRTQLDLKQYTAGISYLESELEETPSDWPQAFLGEIQTVAAQHHAYAQNWEEATNLLYNATSVISDKPLLGRTYFLLGQVLERQERYGEAYSAFLEVENNFPNFEYLYWAQFKKADIARKAERYEVAENIYQAMLRDDKNQARRGRILFEIARIYEMTNRLNKAELQLKDLLHGSERIQQDRELTADIYFRLGKIYGNHYDNYELAAAYFDSSSSLKTTVQEEGENAEELADVYGDYTRLQTSINRADSLLKLGTMSKQQLDSALVKIRVQKQQQLEDEDEEGDTAIRNQQTDDIISAVDPSSEYGYLNFKDAELVAQAKAQFRARWGDRPLVDNWRRVQAIRVADRVGGQGAANSNESNSEDQTPEASVSMNLEDIPKTEQERELLLLQKVEAQYRLGNLLFLNLNMADSARYYFHKVIHNEVAEPLHPQAMYSLFEIFSSENNPDSVAYWGDRIVDEYPQSRYARRVQNRSRGDMGQEIEQDSNVQLLEQYHQYVADSTSKKPAKLKRLALQHKSTELAPHIFYSAIEAYIEEAKKQSSRSESVQPIMDISADSLAKSDSLLARNSVRDQYAFTGAAWDSVRQAIAQFDTVFPNAKQQQRVAKLKEMLEREETHNETKKRCEDLGISLQVVPSMEAFLSTVTYPEEVRDMSISGEVRYNFTVTKEGKIVSYKLVSQNTSLGIEEAFKNAFDEHLQFAPLEVPGNSEIACEVAFPIRH
ncbi:tetratricopeptide repeat protein [Fodinibius sp. Rm-B-1B1-1]|uniref:type IX secretion system periplasmic lipoprotein PorW/SprE n=1 Tax=Fodinibius alkaliphilus TaxID=3140241 RepID=UPI003159C6C8